MRFLSFVSLVLIFLSACSNSSTEPKISAGDNWQLVFEDGFDNGTNNWNLWNSGAYNNEIQLYKPEQVIIENGILNINVKRAKVKGPTFPYDASLKDFEYLSGRIETKSKYGPSNIQGEVEYRFVARIKLPKGAGMWPAFWSTSDPWPTNGEIDILEARGNEPFKFQTNIFYGPTANTVSTKNAVTEKKHQVSSDLTEEFHDYELIWAENYLEIKLDNESVQKYTANDQNEIRSFFGKKHNIIINVAVGGAFIADKNSLNFAEEAQMQVDWVKVYKK